MKLPTQCPECGHDTRIHTYQDGSTRRHVRRSECQAVCLAIRDAVDAEDGLAAQEAWEELRNEAEFAWVWQWLTIRQRDALRSALAVSRVAAGEKG